MAPAAPIKEQIVQAVVSALEAISAANGYVTEAVMVRRPRRTGEDETPENIGLWVIQLDEQRDESVDVVGNPPGIGWRLPIAIDAVCRLGSSRDEPADQVLNTLEADVRRALMADLQLSGLAIETFLGGTEYADPTSGLEGFTIFFEVLYRVSLQDPYTQV